jgi:hypothetical protein
MTRIKRLLAMTTMVAIAAALGLTALATPAQAAPRMTVSGNNDLEGGETLTVKLSGFTPGATLAVGVCPVGRTVTGPGDCGPAGKGYSRLTRSDASGALTTTIKVPPAGKPLGNTSGPKVDCPPCEIAASTIGDGPVEADSVELNYASADSGSGGGGGGGGGGGNNEAGGGAADEDESEPAAAPATEVADTDDSGTAAADEDAPTTAATGPRETLLVGLTALLLLQLGLVMYVRAVRSTPRRLRS